MDRHLAVRDARSPPSPSCFGPIVLRAQIEVTSAGEPIDQRIDRFVNFDSLTGMAPAPVQVIIRCNVARLGRETRVATVRNSLNLQACSGRLGQGKAWIMWAKG